MLEEVSYTLIVIILALNSLIAIYGIVYRRSLVKKLISLTILSDTIFVAVILAGFYFTHPLIPPVYEDLSGGNVDYMIKHASDPLPQALVLTGIVIGLAINALIAFGIIQAYRLTGTTDAKKIIEILSGSGVEE